MSGDVALVSAAVDALVPYLTEAGKKAAATLGAEAAKEIAALWAWVKGKVTGSAKDAFEQAPDDTKAQGKLEGALEQVLEAEPALADELRQLVAAAKPEAARLVQTITQTQTVGDGSVGIQSAGSNNTFNVNKS